MNCKAVLLTVTSLCLVAHCTWAQYQTAPAYGNSYQQQRKVAPSSQGYGQSASAGLMEGSQAAGSGDYEAQQQQRSMGDQKYGAAMQSSGSASAYGAKQQQMGAYSKPQAASGAGNSYAGSMGQSTGAGYGSKSAMGAKYEEPQHPPMPFAYGYDINDGYGNTQYRKENGDEQGKVTGSYGYRDAYGVFRYVDYVADENGFRATVKTNEPGTANESPADVDWRAEEPPAQTNPGNTQAGYGNGGSYGMAGAANEAGSYGQSSGAGGAGSSYGSGSTSSSALMDGQDMSQYASSSSAATSQQGANKYGGPQQAAQQMPADLARQGAGNYGVSMLSMASSSASDNAADSYGSSATSMAGGSGAGQYSSQARPAMGASSANGRRAYGSAMMAALDAGRQGAGYGQQVANQMNAGAGQYGAASGPQQYMGAANGQQQMMMTSAGRSSRYKTSGMSTMGSRANGYGSAMDQVEQQQQRYGASSGMAGEAMQREMPMGATKGGVNGRSSYNDNNSQALAGQMGLGLGSPLDDTPLGGATSGQQQYAADSALAQQYGGAQTSGASRMMLAAMQANDASQQQYSAAGMGMTDPNLLPSTYSSMRLQANGGSPRSLGAQSSGYGMSNGGASGAGSMAYQSKMNGAGRTNQAAAMTDYRKAAGKTIAALAKRY